MNAEQLLPGVKLSAEQMETVEVAARFVAPRLRADFYKSLADCLRPLREIGGSDLNYHASACLQKYSTRSGDRCGWVKRATR